MKCSRPPPCSQSLAPAPWSIWPALPMALGTFAAGVILSDSEYRHELQADIDPFEGLLLGFFFISTSAWPPISISMLDGTADDRDGRRSACSPSRRLLASPWSAGAARAKSRHCCASVSLLAQGSEFGFVLFRRRAHRRCTRPIRRYLDLRDADRGALSMAAARYSLPCRENILVPRLTLPKARAAAEEKIVARRQAGRL